VATIGIGRTTAPLPLKPLTRRVAIAMMDQPLREALGLPRQPAWFVAMLRRALKLRARYLRHLASPRRTSYRHRPATYPHGFALADLGPASMLEELNAEPRHEVS
jgi:hypothetical protein